MTVDDPILSYPVPEEGLPSREVAVHELPDLSLDIDVEHGADERLDLGEAGLPTIPDGVPLTGGGDRRRSCGTGVERGHGAGQPHQVVVADGAVARERRQSLALRHPAHDHEVVADVTIGIRDVGDPQVDVRRQPSVELDLAVARLLPQDRSRLVQERVAHRLLELVRAVADEEDDRDMGLVQGGAGHPVPWTPSAARMASVLPGWDDQHGARRDVEDGHRGAAEHGARDRAVPVRRHHHERRGRDLPRSRRVRPR